MRNFRQLDFYIDSLEFVNGVYEVINTFPKDEKYGLSSQLSRASISIPSNIAEGASRTTAKDFRRFLEIALGSSFEVETLLIIAQKQDFINETHFLHLLEKLTSIQKRLNAYRNSIKD